MKKDKSFKKGQRGSTIDYKNMGWFAVNWTRYWKIVGKVEAYRERDKIVRNPSF